MPHVITRFAPSPTGHLHIGGARTALFCLAYARRHRGSFLLRIEDTDQKRSSEAASRGILEDLAWLGIHWDEGPSFKLGNTTLGGDPRAVGPFYQAERRDIYDTYVNALVERDLAYPAFDAPEHLTAMRQQAEKEKRTFVYRRPADYDRSAALARMNAGEPCPIRFKMPDHPITFRDEVLGDITVSHAELDDFVIRKADGFPTYHFAVVIDDELMGTTHIMRGQEHLNNTPRHVALMQALTRLDTGEPFRIPKFAHLTVIANPDNSKMSKRDRDKAARAKCRDLSIKTQADVRARAHGRPLSAFTAVAPADFERWLTDKTVQLETHALEDLASVIGIELPEIAVDDFRRSGYLPDAVLNYIALLGWNPGEKDAQGRDVERFDTAYLIDRFDFDRVGKSASKFDRAKLLSFNADAIAALSDDALAQTFREWAVENDAAFAARVDALAAPAASPLSTWSLLARAVKPRAKTLRDAVRAAAFLTRDDAAADFDRAAAEKHLLADSRAGLAVLVQFRAALAALPEWSPDSIHAAMESLAVSLGLVTDRGPNVGPIAQPARIAIAGVPVTPPLGESLALLGKARALARIDRCLAAFA